MTSQKTLEIAPAAPGDADEIAALYLASRNDALPFLPRIHSDVETRAWIADVMMKRGRVWVARRRREIVGFLALEREQIDQLYVLPGCCRQGIGSALLEVAKAESPERLQLFTFQRNLRARAFYESLRFLIVDANDGSRNEEGEPDILYEWRAGNAANARKAEGSI